MSQNCRLVRRPHVQNLLAALLAASALTACDDADPARATLSVAGTLAAPDTAGYARAVGPREFRFPHDHGPHPEFKHEWWYFTGNVEVVEDAGDGLDFGPAVVGREFGFQLTFFRSALRPDSPDVTSPWAARQAYMGHFALTDIGGGAFDAFERFDRGALGLAGAEAAPMRVWIGDWEVRSIQDGSTGAGGFRLRAAEGRVAVDMILTPTQPIVLQGEAGLSRKGPEPGNASYYYSMMRLAAEGTLNTADGSYRVRGAAWLDREWGTSALSPGVVGWDWFSLQLDDDSELMIYRLRREDGGTAPFSAGTFVAPDGTVSRLAADDFTLDHTGRWTSPRGVDYPSGWRVRVPRLDLSLRVEPRRADQELDLAFRYWEGAVAASGRRAGRQVAGKGYVELTGY